MSGIIADYYEWIQLGGIFLGVCGLSFVLVSLVVRRPRPHALAGTEGAPDDTAMQLVLGEYTTALADYMPGSRGATRELTNELRSAGFYRRTAVKEYRAVRNLLVLVALLATATTALLVPAEWTTSILVGGLVFTALAFSVPRVFVGIRGRERARSMERGLPLAIDMLILCLSSGQNLLAALQQVALQLRNSNPVLAQELAIAHQQAELHSLANALQQWADRVQLPEVRNLALVMIQSEKLGADAVGTLSELANNFRTTARQRAETQANRASFWMMFPSVLCFWVASAIVLVAPAYLEYFYHRENTVRMIREGAGQIKDLAVPQTQENGDNLPSQDDAQLP